MKIIISAGGLLEHYFVSCFYLYFTCFPKSYYFSNTGTFFSVCTHFYICLEYFKD